MKAPARVDLALAALCVGVVGIYDIAYAAFSLAHGRPIGPYIDVLFPDLLVFHAAAQAFLAGKLSIVHGLAATTQCQNDQCFPERFSALATFRPFFHPPVWLLMVLPLALWRKPRLARHLIRYTPLRLPLSVDQITPWTKLRGHSFTAFRSLC